MPRDRDNSFQPKVLGKSQGRTADIEEKVVSMYAKGMTVREIEVLFFFLLERLLEDGERFLFCSSKNLHLSPVF